MQFEAAAVRLAKVERHLVPVSPKTAWIFLEVEFDDGARGFGEATAFGAEQAMLLEIDAFAAVVSAERPEVMGPALGLLAGRQESGVRRTLVHALEQALFDALARRAGLSLATLLGGPARRRIPVYANINRGIADRSPAGFARQARAVIAEEGYHAIKIAPFDGYRWERHGGREGHRLIEAGVERVRAVREALGPQIDILVDCHNRFDPVGARTIIRELAAAGLFWIEEPLDAGVFAAADLRSVRSAAHQAGTRIAGGERLETLRATSELIEAGGCDVILPDLRATGIRQGMAMLQLAVASGVAASLHNPVGPVLDAVSRHVAAALPDFLILERQVRETPLYEALRGGPVAIVDGAAALEDAAGNGLRIDRDVLARATARPFAPVLSFAGMAGAGPDA